MFKCDMCGENSSLPPNWLNENLTICDKCYKEISNTNLTGIDVLEMIRYYGQVNETMGIEFITVPLSFLDVIEEKIKGEIKNGI